MASGHVPLGAVENSQLGLGSQVESRHRRRNRRIELLQAGRPDDVPLAVGFQPVGGQIAGQNGQRGGVDVDQRLGQGIEFRGGGLVALEDEQVIAVDQQQLARRFRRQRQPTLEAWRRRDAASRRPPATPVVSCSCHAVAVNFAGPFW